MPDRNPTRRRRNRRPGRAFPGHRTPTPNAGSGLVTIVGALLLDTARIELTFSHQIDVQGTAWNQMRVNSPGESGYCLNPSVTGDFTIELEIANEMTNGNGTFTIDGPTGITFDGGAVFQTPTQGHYTQDF